MKKAILILFVVPALLVIFFETDRTTVKEWNLDSPNKRYPSLVRDQWMGIYYKGEKLGFTYSALFKGEEGFRSTSRALIKLSTSGSVQETSFNNETILSREKELMSFYFAQEMSGHRQVIEGKKSSEKIEMEITSAGAVSRKAVPFPKEGVTGNTLAYSIIERGLVSGKQYPVTLFIEPLQTTITLDITVIGLEEVTIAGKKINAYKIEEKFKTLKAYTWITEEGVIIKEVSLEGLVSVMETKERATQFSKSPISVNSFINLSLVRTQKTIESQEDLEQIKVRIGGLSETMVIPEDDRQRVEGSSIDEGGNKTATLRINKRNVRREAGIQAKSQYLSPTPEIQSDYPKIISRASQITGMEKDSYQKALLILIWVFDYMKKKPVDTFTAADALKSGEGECQSHTNLFAALARASKIPTRVASGLVYSKQNNGFLYHAWPEVYVGQWIAMDPTFGQERADPTHIKLSTGGWAEQLSLLEFIGKISIEILDVSDVSEH